MNTETIPQSEPLLSRRLVGSVKLAHLLLIGIISLSLVLHLSNLEAIRDANTYYTAAVESMTQSWRNFFFVAAEPGGSVTVDKPPLGLWVEAAFALVFGVSGVTTSLPNMLAGVFSVPLLYSLVKKYTGELAGLMAALVLVVTPVAIATDRNNTMDGMLVFTLLLAAWAFITATETGKARWLFLGALLVGLGFNIKMLQAFLPLPAFYALYFLGAKTAWWRKILHAGVSVIILVVVSLSWAIIVDLTPADQRPYIGSSDNNTVMELIVGHNGLSRLFSGGRKRIAAPNAPADNGDLPPAAVNQNGQAPVGSPPAEALVACKNMSQGDACAFTLRNGEAIRGACILSPGANQLACVPQGNIPVKTQTSTDARPGINPPPGALGDGPNASPNPNDPQIPGGTPFSQETGSPGLWRFFVSPLSKQMSWLLPFALVSIIVLLFAARARLPLAPAHKALVLWGGWLLTCLVFFSAIEGIFHAYYAIMLAPALGALAGAGTALLWRRQATNRIGSAVFVIAAAGTIVFQIFTAYQYSVSSAWIYLPIIPLVTGISLMLSQSLRPVARLTILSSLLLIPLIWTSMTVLDKTPNVNLPTSFEGGNATQVKPRPAPELNKVNKADSDLAAFLQANTQDTEYLVAVPNSHAGSPLVLATGRPVLYMGGFSGGDPVVDAEGLAEMVRNSELRFVLFGGNGKRDIARWLASACEIVPEFSQGKPNAQISGGSGRPGSNQLMVLYQCR